jgi:cell wall-associated NlpC family hydrolase
MAESMFVGGTSVRTGSGPGFVTWLCLLGLLPLILLEAGCATTGAVPQPFPRPGGPALPSGSAPRPVPASGHSAGAANGYAIAGTALGLRGSPYRNGGSDPSGFDCSGFVRYVFAQHGIGLGRTVGEQFHEGAEVKAGVEAGDLIFFATSNSGAVSHVGMAIGGDEFVHAPSSRGEVRVERLTAPYWASRYIGARRIR